MRTHRARALLPCFVLIALSVASTALVRAEPSFQVRLDAARVEVNRCADKVTGWHEQEIIGGILLGVVVLAGIVTASLQGQQGTWAKKAPFILGAIVSGATLAGTVFLDADFKTMRQRVADGKGYVTSANQWLAQAVRVQGDSDQNFMLQQVASYVASFKQIGAPQGGQTIQPPPSVMPVAHAQEAACGCLQNRPRDEMFLYACGNGQGRSVAEAHANAATDAVTGAVASLRQKLTSSNTSPSAEALSAYVRRVATEADSCVRFTPADSATASNGFTVSLLLRMPTDLTAPGAQAAFVGHPEGPAIPSAAGQMGFTAAAWPSSPLSVTVQAVPSTFGDFVFTFQLRRAPSPALVLTQIVVRQAGSASRTKWRFAFVVNGDVVASLDTNTYTSDPSHPIAFNDSQHAVVIPLTGAFPYLGILGYRP